MKSFKYWLYEIRPLHWIKNNLVLLPLVFANKWMEAVSVEKALLAFAAFCFAASAVYIFNDLIDLDKDRHHPLKRMRPLAAGKIKREPACALAAVLLAAAVFLSLKLGREFYTVMFAYILLNAVYVKLLKEVVILDVMTLAGFYVLRVLGGMVAIDARISYWMIICIALLALFLGFNKRRHELKLLEKSAELHRSVLGQYSTYFIDQMIAVVTTLSLMSYTLYTIDADTVARMGTRKLLFTVPFVYYGIFRYFFLVHKRGKGGDPVRIFASDIPMIVNVILWIAACAWIIHFK